MCRRIAYVAVHVHARPFIPTHPINVFAYHSEGTRWARCGVRFFVHFHSLYPPCHLPYPALQLLTFPFSLAAFPAPLSRRYHGLQLK
jgi:hypothetical protein